MRAGRVVTGLLVLGVAGCGGAGQPDTPAMVNVCVGEDTGRELGWDVEVVQDGEVVGRGSVEGSSQDPAVPSQVGIDVPPGPLEVRFDDGEPIGVTELDGGSITFSVGDGCPLTP